MLAGHLYLLDMRCLSELMAAPPEKAGAREHAIADCERKVGISALPKSRASSRQPSAHCRPDAADSIVRNAVLAPKC